MPCKMPLPLLIQDQKPEPKPGQKAPKARKTEKPENARTVLTISAVRCVVVFLTAAERRLGSLSAAANAVPPSIPPSLPSSFVPGFVRRPLPPVLPSFRPSVRPSGSLFSPPPPPPPRRRPPPPPPLNPTLNGIFSCSKLQRRSRCPSVRPSVCLSSALCTLSAVTRRHPRQFARSLARSIDRPELSEQIFRR